MRGLLARLLLTVSVACGAGAATPQAFAKDAQSARSCRSSPVQSEWYELDGGRELVLHRDLDGDGRRDSLRASESFGSGHSSIHLSASLSGDDSTLELQMERSFDALTAEVEVPARLRRDPALRQAVEEILFPRLCTRAEESLRVAMTGEPRWQVGPPEPPEAYTLFRQQEGAAIWLSYSGHMVASRRGDKAAFRVLDRKGALELFGSSHGVVLVDRKRARHAWLYVFPGNSGHKLRWPSIESGTLRGTEAHIELSLRGPRDRGESERVIDLSVL